MESRFAFRPSAGRTLGNTRQVMQRRGTVFIAPSAHFPADGRMVDPGSARFWVSWQDDAREGLIEDDEIVGAADAIKWGRERSTDVRFGSVTVAMRTSGPEKASSH
jgi:hypothetical protein